MRTTIRFAISKLLSIIHPQTALKLCIVCKRDMDREASNAVRESATASPQMPRSSGCSGRPHLPPAKQGPTLSAVDGVSGIVLAHVGFYLTFDLEMAIESRGLGSCIYMILEERRRFGMVPTVDGIARPILQVLRIGHLATKEGRQLQICSKSRTMV
jgi:hypothetical protein